MTRAGSRALDELRAGRSRRARGGAAAPGGLRRDRPHQHDRVRLFRPRHQSALRHAEKRVEPRASATFPAARPRARRSSVADRHGHGALGTDTGGSCRIPAAFNGIVGYKPTQRRVPLDGGVPLSSSLDSFGPLAHSVACCAILDAVLADERRAAAAPRPVKGMRLAVPTTIALDDLDAEVAKAFERALTALSSKAGARSSGSRCRNSTTSPVMNSKGGFSAAESYAWHRYLLTSKGDVYDPRVASASCAARASAPPTTSTSRRRGRSFIARTERASRPTTRWCMPTIAITPPRHRRPRRRRRPSPRTNLRVLRNCTLINMLDGCAISLPVASRGRGSGRPDARGGAGGDAIAESSNSRPEWRMSSVFDLTFDVDDKGGADAADACRSIRLVIAGWTGRDPVARDKHIAELEAIGIARPATTPIYYRCSARRHDLADRIEVCGEESSGEVEFVLIGWQGAHLRRLRLRPYRPQGRDLQRHGVEADVRQADGLGAVGTGGRHRATGTGWCCAPGPRSAASGCSTRRVRWTRMLPVEGLDRRAASAATACPTAAPCSAAPSRPRAASGRPSRFDFELEDPVLKRKISHGYDVVTMPVRG